MPPRLHGRSAEFPDGSSRARPDQRRRQGSTAPQATDFQPLSGVAPLPLYRRSVQLDCLVADNLPYAVTRPDCHLSDSYGMLIAANHGAAAIWDPIALAAAVLA